MVRDPAPRREGWSRVIDRAIQAFGGAGVTSDTPLARMWANIRTLRIADGPDEVHRMSIAKQEIRRRRAWAPGGKGVSSPGGAGDEQGD